MSERTPVSFWVFVGVAALATVIGFWWYSVTGRFPWTVAAVAVVIELAYYTVGGFYGTRGWRRE